jgi:hypothetical protein
LTEVNPAFIKQTSIRYIVAGDTSLQRKHRNLKAPCITPAKTEKKQEHPEDRRPPDLPQASKRPSQAKKVTGPQDPEQTKLKRKN